MKTNDYLIASRIPLELAVTAREIASQQGFTLSSFIRQAIKRNVDAYNLNERNIVANFK